MSLPGRRPSAGWVEAANQWQLDEDQRRVLAEHYAVLAGDFDKGAIYKRRLGPYVVRDADRDVRRAAGAQKRRPPPTVRIVSDMTRGEELAGAIREGDVSDPGPVEPAIDDAVGVYLAGLTGAEAAKVRRVIEALVEAEGNRSKAAEIAGLSRPTVLKIIRRLEARRPAK